MAKLNDQELHNLAMNIVGKELEEQGYEFLGVNSEIKKDPQFVALKDKRDGHEFLDIAESDGATGALVAKCNHNLSLPQLLADNTLDSLQNIAAEYRKIFTGEIVGITGSCGKTSTKTISRRSGGTWVRCWQSGLGCCASTL